MDTDERPKIHCLVSFELRKEGTFHEPFITSLQTAARLHETGWIVLVDPADECALAEWEARRRGREAYGFGI